MLMGMSEVERHVPVRGGISFPALPPATFFLRICFCFGFAIESEDEIEVAEVAELSLSESDNGWSEGNKYLGGLTKGVSPPKRDANRVIGPEEVEGCGFLRDANRVIGPLEVEG